MLLNIKMPTSAVYQPTTVTYEQQPNEQRWNCPISYYTRRVASTLNDYMCVQATLCFVGGLLFLLGMALLITGGVQYCPTGAVDGSDNGFAAFLSGGIILALGVVMIVIGGWSWSGRYARGKEAPAGGAAALTALNPSTDPLVAAQYAPVRDAPPAPDDEMRNLMDNKECLSSAEESDKMLDGQPTVA